MEDFSNFILKNFENGEEHVIETILISMNWMFLEHPKTINFFNQHKLLWILSIVVQNGSEKNKSMGFKLLHVLAKEDINVLQDPAIRDQFWYIVN